MQTILICIQFSLTLGRATDGDKLYDVDTKLNELKKQNTGLERQINEITTIDNIYKFALNTGFIPQTLVQIEPAPVAARLNTP